jgi:hypothetical protein
MTMTSLLASRFARFVGAGAAVLGLAQTGCSADAGDGGDGGDDVDGDSVATSEDALSLCTTWGSGGCSRPLVKVIQSFDAIHDGDGKPGGTVGRGTWSVSSCTQSLCSIYRKGGNLFVVGRVALLQHAGGEVKGKKPLEVVRLRTMPSRGSRPSGKTLVSTPIDIPDQKEANAFAPPDTDGIGSNQSLSCRGNPCVVWGVETPTNVGSTGTGYAGQLIHAGDEVVDTGERASGATWVDAKGRPAARAKWARVWSKAGGEWARQWVLMQVTPMNGSKPYVLLTSK